MLLLNGCLGGGAVRPSYYYSRGSSASIEKKDSQKASSKHAKTSKTSVSKTDRNLIRAAERYLGVRYRYGGTTSRGFDCSGYIWRVFNDVGYDNFPRLSSQAMYKKGRAVSRSAAKVGDLCFFRGQSGRAVGHVGIYAGNGQFIHASSSRGIMYSPLSDTYWKPRFISFRRYN